MRPILHGVQSLIFYSISQEMGPTGKLLTTETGNSLSGRKDDDGRSPAADTSQ